MSRSARSAPNSLFSRRQLTWIIYGAAIAIILLSALGKPTERQPLAVSYQQAQGLRLYRVEPAGEERELRLLFRAGSLQAPPGQARLAYEHVRQQLNQDPLLQQLLDLHQISPFSKFGANRVVVGLRWQASADAAIEQTIRQLSALIASATTRSPDDALIRRLRAEEQLRPPVEITASEALRQQLLRPVAATSKASSEDLADSDALAAFMRNAYGLQNLTLALQYPSDDLSWLPGLLRGLPAGTALAPWNPQSAPAAGNAVQVAIAAPRLLMARPVAGRAAEALASRLLAVALLQQRLNRQVPTATLALDLEAQYGLLELSAPADADASLHQPLLAALGQATGAEELERAREQLLTAFSQQRSRTKGRGRLVEQVALDGLPLSIWSDFETSVAYLPAIEVDNLLQRWLTPEGWSYRYLLPINQQQ